jgi:hypothetical protein
MDSRLDAADFAADMSHNLNCMWWLVVDLLPSRLAPLTAFELPTLTSKQFLFLNAAAMSGKAYDAVCCCLGACTMQIASRCGLPAPTLLNSQCQSRLRALLN